MSGGQTLFHRIFPATTKVLTSKTTVDWHLNVKDAEYNVGWPQSSLTTTTPKYFDQLLIYVNLYQHVKNLTISLISSGDMVDSGPYLRNKNFPKYEIGAETQQII